MFGQRLIHFCGQTIAIDYANGECKKVVEFLYQQLHKPKNDSSEPHTSLQLNGTAEQGFTLSHSEETIYAGNSSGELATALIGETIFHLTDNNADGMVLHAGCISNLDHGVLIPGKSGAGKSTLSAWLTRYGYHYLTDEMVFIANNDKTLHAFQRPINIKNHGLDAVKDFVDIENNETMALSSSHVTMMNQDLFRDNNEYTTPSIGLILFPHHRANSAYELIRLSGAQAALQLMECLINARNLDGHGLSQASKLAKQVPSYQLTYSSFDQLDESFFEILPDIAIETA